MITISLCMIVKNEEEVIGRCLESVKDVVDEINIVDTGSTDQTKQIVQQYTNRIYDFKWINHFAAARNFSFEKATKEYILWLDADDVLLPEDQEKLKELKKSLQPSIDAVSMNYKLSVDEEGNVTSFIRRNRLVKREKNFQWIGAVHEYLSVFGNILDSQISVSHKPLSHDTDRNITIYTQLIESGKELSPRDIYYYANELKDHSRYEEAVEYYERFLNSNQGWFEDCIQACFKIADCYTALQKNEQVFNAILRSFQYDVPRPEACCRLGYQFMEKQRNEEAIYWYQQALLVKEKPNSPFQNKIYTTWLPHLQLCVLYDRLEQYELAKKHNEAAEKFKPSDERILHNKAYLEALLKTNLD